MGTRHRPIKNDPPEERREDFLMKEFAFNFAEEPLTIDCHFKCKFYYSSIKVD